jgi:hypothetical protein
MLFQVSQGVLLQVTGSCGHQEAPGVMTVRRGAGRWSSRSRPPGKQFLRTVLRTDEGRAVLYCNSRVFQRTKKSLDDCCRSARVSFESGLSVPHVHVAGIASCF